MKHMKLSSVVFSFALLVSAMTLDAAQVNVAQHVQENTVQKNIQTYEELTNNTNDLSNNSLIQTPIAEPVVHNNNIAPKHVNQGRIAKVKTWAASWIAYLTPSKIAPGYNVIADTNGNNQNKKNSLSRANVYKIGGALAAVAATYFAYRTGAHKHVKIPNSFKFKFNIW